MNIFLQKKTILFSFLFFIIMAVYALLRELRDAVFIYLVGLPFLPQVKVFSLVFLFFELLFYQKLIDMLNPRRTFFFFSIIYSILLLVFAFIFFYFKVVPVFFGYLFYILLEGYSPFIWSLLWAIFTAENTPTTVKKNYMFASLFAQLGGFVFSLFFYYLIKKNIFLTINFLFVSIMLTSSFLLGLAVLLISLLNNDLVSVSIEIKEVDKKYQYSNVLLMWYYSFKKIIESFYVFGIFLIIFCWEVINIILNYFRLDVLLEKTTLNSVYLLQDLYYSISITYFLGIFVVLIGASFLVRLYGVRKTLIAFPVLIFFSVLPLLIGGKKKILVMIYMVIKALYPALIFPIKESLYLITSQEIRYKSKSWIDGLGSRLSKTVAAFYIQISLCLFVENRYILHIAFFSLLLLVFLFITNYVGKTWEEKVKKNEIIE